MNSANSHLENYNNVNPNGIENHVDKWMLDTHKEYLMKAAVCVNIATALSKAFL